MKVYLLFVLLAMIFACIISGCLTPPEDESSQVFPAQPTVTMTSSQPLSYANEPAFVIESLHDPERRYRPDGSCYFVVSVAARNIGDQDATNVIIHCRFIDMNSGDTSTQNELYPQFNSGERKIFIKQFDGACTHTYRMEFEVDFDRI